MAGHLDPSDPLNKIIAVHKLAKKLRRLPTVLHLLARDDQVAQARRHIARDKPDLEAQDRLGITPLGNAVGRGYPDMVRLLLRAGANPNARDCQNESTPLHYAAQTNRLSIGRMLIKHGADVNAKERGGVAPLHLAARGRLAIARLLVKSGARVNVRDVIGWTPLHAAVDCSLLSIIRLLLSHGANVNAAEEKHGTPLHFAVIWGDSIPVARLLLRHGARINSRDRDGTTALGWALKCHKTAMADFLRRNGGRE